MRNKHPRFKHNNLKDFSRTSLASRQIEVITDAKLRYASRLRLLSRRIQRNAVCADRNKKHQKVLQEYLNRTLTKCMDRNVDGDYKQFLIDIKTNSRFSDKFHAVICNSVDPMIYYEITIQWIDTSTVKEH